MTKQKPTQASLSKDDEDDEEVLPIKREPELEAEAELADDASVADATNINAGGRQQTELAAEQQNDDDE